MLLSAENDEKLLLPSLKDTLDALGFFFESEKRPKHEIVTTVTSFFCSGKCTWICYQILEHEVHKSDEIETPKNCIYGFYIVLQCP